MKETLRTLLRKDKIEQVINKLLSITEVVNDNHDLRDQVILLSADYYYFKKEKKLNTSLSSDLQVLRGRINAGLLDVINSLPDAVKPTNFQRAIYPRNKVIELIIDQNFDTFNSIRIEDLKRRLSEILQINSQNIVIRRLERGSVKMYLEMPEDKALELDKIFKAGAYAGILIGLLKIQKITLINWWTLGIPLLKVIAVLTAVPALIIAVNVLMPDYKPLADAIKGVHTGEPSGPNVPSGDENNGTLENPDAASSPVDPASPQTGQEPVASPKTGQETVTPPESLATNPPVTIATNPNVTPETPPNKKTPKSKDSYSLIRFSYNSDAIWGKSNLNILTRIRSAEDSLPLKGINVIINNKRYVTDSSGYISAKINKSSGEPEIYFQHPKYKPFRVNFNNYPEQLSRNNILAITAYLQKQEYSLESMRISKVEFLSYEWRKTKDFTGTVRTNIAKKTDRLEICFKIEAGPPISGLPEEVHLQVIAPDGAVLGSNIGTDLATGKNYRYTVAKSIEPPIESKEVCLLYEGEKFVPGIYTGVIWHRGQKIGVREVRLK